MNEPKRRPAWREKFLRRIRNGRPETEALQTSGVGRSRLNQELRRDPEFKKEYQDALVMKADRRDRAYNAR